MALRWTPLLLAPALLACGRPIPEAELPSEPIAFIRQEPREGVASLSDFMDALEMRAMTRTERAQRREHAPARTSIALLTPSTGEMRTLPDSGLGSYPLDWSSDGLRLLIGRMEPGAMAIQLFSWNRLTGATDRLTPDRSQGAASFGDGPIRLSFVGRSLRPGAAAEPGVMVYTSEGIAPLPDAVGGRSPDVAADGSTVVFVRDTGRRGRDGVILLGRLGSSEARPIAHGDRPRFSRDGRWITYTSRRLGNADVWLMRADGGSKRALTRSSFDEEFPAVSPDGRYVVYSAARGDQAESQLFLTRVADLAEIQLTQHSQNGRPVW